MLAGETKKLFERLWLAKDKLGSKIGFASIICHSQEPAATQELFTALPGYFGFATLRPPLLSLPRKSRPGGSRLARWASRWRHHTEDPRQKESQ